MEVLEKGNETRTKNARKTVDLTKVDGVAEKLFAVRKKNADMQEIYIYMRIKQNMGLKIVRCQGQRTMKS